ncbi:MAG TPA: SDR family oxidoreductase [Kiloniellaceae bacterium]|nr:SDR family oxidoreductase [Kiloniellaceae bacterium]
MSGELFSLEGHTALITGGGSGIGQAIAEALSDAGAAILLAGRRLERLEAALGSRTGACHTADVATPDGVAALSAWALQRNQPPAVLVNAAGINLRQPAGDITPESWDRTLDLNLKTPFFLAQALVPAMREKGWGRIINIASLQSERAFENGMAYGASKGGITQLTRAMAEAWSRYGINANAIGPGFFPTDLTQTVFDDDARAEKLAAQTAIGRNGNLADLAGPAVFLASPASDYVTGQVLYVDGGFTAK